MNAVLVLPIYEAGRLEVIITKSCSPKHFRSDDDKGKNVSSVLSWFIYLVAVLVSGCPSVIAPRLIWKSAESVMDILRWIWGIFFHSVFPNCLFLDYLDIFVCVRLFWKNIVLSQWEISMLEIWHILLHSCTHFVCKGERADCL